MRTIFLLKPEVPGQLGSDSVITNLAEIQAGTDKYLKIEKLVLVLDGWLGDDLLTTHPCYIITKTVCDKLVTTELSGFELEEIEVRRSKLFNDLHSNRIVPKLFRLKPKGKVKIANEKVTEWSGEDFALDEQGFLYVSEAAVKFLSSFSLKHCAKLPRDVEA